MKNKLIVPLIAIAAIVASCQNQQSNSQTNDSVANADSSGHAMGDSSSNMKDSSIMVAMNKMMDNMHKMEQSGNADHDFAMLMIGHHQSAIEMAQMELNYGTHEEMKTMASKIIEEQQKEIKDLQEWLLANNNK